MYNIKEQNDLAKNLQNDQKINSINAELSARFQRYRSSPTSVTALIQILQQKMRILAVNNNIPIPYCLQFQKSIVNKIRTIPQMNSTHVDYIQSLYDKQIENLENKTSVGNKILNLMNERSKILKDVKVMLVKEKLSSNGQKKPSLNLSYLGQNISKLRDLALGIIQHLSLWKSSLSSTGQDQYSKLILQCISKDVQFLRSTPLRKFLQFSSSQDPLFLYSMKKFWKLELNTNYNSRAIMKLFEVSNSYKKRLLNAEKFTKCFDPNAVIYEYPFGDTDQDDQNMDHFPVEENTGQKLFERNKQLESTNLPSISQKNIPNIKNNKSQSYSSEARSLQPSPKKAFELLRPIIQEAKLNKYGRPVNMMNHGKNEIQPASFGQNKFHQNHAQTESIKHPGPNRKYRVMTQTQGDDVKESMKKRYPMIQNSLKDNDNNIDGKHKMFTINDKRRKLKPIFNHSLSNHHQHLNGAIEALNELLQVDEDSAQFYQLSKNQQGGSSKKTIKIPNTLQQRADNNFKRLSLNFQPESLNSHNQFLGKRGSTQKIYNQIHSKIYQTEDQYDKQNLLMNSELKKQMKLEAIKKKQLQLQKALKRYEMQEIKGKKYKTIEKNSRNQNRHDDPLSYGAPTSMSSKIRIKPKNSYQKSHRSKKDTIGKVKQFNSMDQEYEEQDSKVHQTGQIEEGPYNKIEVYSKPKQQYSPVWQNALIPSPKKNEFLKDNHGFGPIEKSLEKSPKSTNRQNGKIKIIPMVYKNGELSPQPQKSQRKVQSLQKEQSRGKQEDQVDNQTVKSSNKILMQQSIQTVEKLPEDGGSKTLNLLNPNQTGKNLEQRQRQSKISNKNQRRGSPVNVSPYSQYLNQPIKEGVRKNDPNGLYIKNQEEYQNKDNRNLNVLDSRAGMVQSVEGPKQQIPKSLSLQKIQTPNKSSSKNLVETKHNQNFSSLGNYQGIAPNTYNHKENGPVAISDEPISDYELPKNQQQRISPIKEQTPKFDDKMAKSNIQSLVNTKIEPKSQSNMNTQMSPQRKYQSTTKDQGSPMKQEDNRNAIAQQEDNRQLYWQQGPVSSHEIYEVVVEGKGQQSKQSLVNQNNKQLPNRAPSLLSNRSGNESHRSSMSKSSSMKLESQTSQAMNDFGAKTNNQRSPERVNQKSPEYVMNKNQLVEEVKNDVKELNRKLETIQENESYGQMTENPSSPQHKAMNPPIFSQKSYQIDTNTQRNQQKPLNGSPYPNDTPQFEKVQQRRRNEQSVNRPGQTNPVVNNPVINHQQGIQKDKSPVPQQQANKSSQNLGKPSLINNAASSQVMTKNNNANGLPQVNNNNQAGPQSSMNSPNINPNHINQQNLITQNQTKPLLSQQNPNNQFLIQQSKTSNPQITQQKTNAFRQPSVTEIKPIPTQKAQIIMYPRNTSQMSVTAQKGSDYKYKQKDRQLGVTISEYSDSDYDVEDSDDSGSDNREQVNVYSKEHIVKKEKVDLQKQSNPASWVNPQQKNIIVEEGINNGGNRGENSLVKGKQETAKQDMGTNNNIPQASKIDNKNNNQPNTNNNNVPQNSNNLQKSNQSQSSSINNQPLTNSNQSGNIFVNKNSNPSVNSNSNSNSNLNHPVFNANQPSSNNQGPIPQTQQSKSDPQFLTKNVPSQEIKGSQEQIPYQEVNGQKTQSNLKPSLSQPQSSSPQKVQPNQAVIQQNNTQIQNPGIGSQATQSNMKPSLSQAQSSSSPQKPQPNQSINQENTTTKVRNQIPDKVVKLNSISHDNDTTTETIKLNTISHNNTQNNIILPKDINQPQKTISQGNNNKTVANLSSIQSNHQNSKSNFIGNYSTLNLNLPNNHDTISSEDFSRKNTIESNKEPNSKPPLNPNLCIDTSSPNKIPLKSPNPSPSNPKNNDPTSNQASHRNGLHNATISETSSQYVTEYSQNRLKAIAEMANNLTKCVFQSKSISKSELPKLLQKYKVNQQVIQQIDQGYFSHRQIYLNLCLLNDEVISVILSHPAFVGAQRIVYIVLFKVVSDKYLDLSSRLLATTIKYFFYNDPCENVICLKPKDEYLDQKDKNIEKRFLEQIKNIKGKIKNYCVDPLLTGVVRPSVFDESNYIVNRKDINCKNDEEYLNNIEFEVFIVGKQSIKVPQKAGKLQLSSDYRATVQKMFTSTQRTNLIKVFKSKAQLFEYTQEEQVGDFGNYKALASIKQNEGKELYLYERHLCKLDPQVKYTTYGGVYYFLLEDKRAWYWEKNNIGYFIIKCQVVDRPAQQSGNDMASELSSRSSISDLGAFGKNDQKPKGNEFYYIYIDYVFESQDLVDGAALIKQNIEAKPANQILKTSQQNHHKMITVPCYQSRILMDRYNSDGYIFNFKMNLTWKNYLKGIRTMPEDDILAEFIAPFYIGVLMKDENDIMRFVAGTFVSTDQQNTQQ